MRKAIKEEKLLIYRDVTRTDEETGRESIFSFSFSLGGNEVTLVAVTILDFDGEKYRKTAYYSRKFPELNENYEALSVPLDVKEEALTAYLDEIRYRTKAEFRVL